MKGEREDQRMRIKTTAISAPGSFAYSLVVFLWGLGFRV